MLQALPLDVKILKTKQRIREWVDRFGVDGTYISFSGGKDSTVLLDLVRQEYPDIPAVFIDTGLEYTEVREFVKAVSNVETIKPKMKFTEVIEKYGFPLISKETAKNIFYGRRAKRLGDQHMFDYYINGHRHNKKTGLDYIHMPLPKKWIPLLESDIPISNQCCQVMKKDPAKKYEKETGRHPFIGEMAEDSKERQTQYLHTSCNAFDGKRPISKPLGFWTEQDILQYIKENELEICSVYGNIVEGEGGILKTTGVSRTGCCFCCFGVHLQEEPNKFQQMKITHPKLWSYCIFNLRIGKMLDFIGAKYE